MGVGIEDLRFDVCLTGVRRISGWRRGVTGLAGEAVCCGCGCSCEEGVRSGVEIEAEVIGMGMEEPTPTPANLDVVEFHPVKESAKWSIKNLPLDFSGADFDPPYWQRAALTAVRRLTLRARPNLRLLAP
jgi:hypothetical protein